ncbi:MAG: tetratricopeptide repeat protein [Nocardioides sp.]|nr:tetratricopeptide repeat protein [Nocardioides sp.]
MTQQPFSRPGAIDLSALKRPAPPAGGTSPGGAGGGGAAGSSAYAVAVDEQSFQEILESSMTAPVLLAFYSPTQMPASADLAADLRTVVGELEGRLLLGTVDIDAVPQIAQAMQIPSIPLVALVLQGRPMPLFQDVVGIDELRTALAEVLQQVAAQGVTGRHQPRGAAAPEPAEGDEGEEPGTDPRFAAADEAMQRGDVDAAVAEYQKLVDANPADTEATGGLAMAKVLQRTRGVDLNEARATAADRPDDVDAQTMVADLDLLGGHVEDAFARLVELVRRSAGDERAKARDHLVELFGAVGADDPRVRKGRQALASALF